MPISNLEANEGVYLGIDVASGRNIYWDVQQSFSPHILVVGPTGSGKTITLLSLACRLKTKYKCPLIILDIKDEYRYLIKMLRYDDIVALNSLEVPIPLCYCNTTLNERHKMVSEIVDTISKVFSLSSSLSRVLYDALFDICTQCIDIDNLNYALEIHNEDLKEVVEVVTRLFNVYSDTSFHQLLDLSSQKVYVFNLKPLFLKSRIGSSILILYLIKLLLRQLDVSTALIPRMTIIVDELWHALPYIAEDLINILTRYGRGFGLVLLMSTQHIDDLYPYTDAIVNNCGVFIAMASQSINYWQRLRTYLNLSNKAIEYAATLRNQGEAVARLSPYKTPVYLYIDPFDDS